MASNCLPHLRDTELCYIGDAVSSSSIRVFVKNFVHSVDIADIFEQLNSQ